jgi:hypothetical protein
MKEKCPIEPPFLPPSRYKPDRESMLRAMDEWATAHRGNGIRKRAVQSVVVRASDSE